MILNVLLTIIYIPYIKHHIFYLCALFFNYEKQIIRWFHKSTDPKYWYSQKFHWQLANIMNLNKHIFFSKYYLYHSAKSWNRLKFVYLNLFRWSDVSPVLFLRNYLNQLMYCGIFIEMLLWKPTLWKRLFPIYVWIFCWSFDGDDLWRHRYLLSFSICQV